MPWGEKSTMSLRQEFIVFALQEGSNIRGLSRRFGISAKTGYKWLNRYLLKGEPGLQDVSRRPHHSPTRTESSLEQSVLSVRRRHPTWGGRKIRAFLLNQGVCPVPCASTITEILRRHHRLEPKESGKRVHWKRFEHEAPNQLWQMDFKGHFAMVANRCHPLTILDDHSRFNVCLQACGNERGSTVRNRLISVFRLYGLPQALLMDNGPPWGADRGDAFTFLTVWLLRLGIRITHGRPYHPQTQGKEERFHRTLKADLLQNRVFRDLEHCQAHFDRWRKIYNFERPHEALEMKTPGKKYHPSHRPFPETLPSVEYAPGEIVRKVQSKGEIYFKNKRFKVGKGFYGQPVALKPTLKEGVLDVYFMHQKITSVDINSESIT